MPKTIVHIGENSPEEVAYRLMERIASVEDKVLFSATDERRSKVADRKWILDTYAECIDAVIKPWNRLP